jgi:hypothetical protein
MGDQLLVGGIPVALQDAAIIAEQPGGVPDPAATALPAILYDDHRQQPEDLAGGREPDRNGKTGDHALLLLC